MSVRYEQRGSVGIATIDRPERRNSVDRQTALALAAAVTTFEADDETRVLVITGSGGTFCAGADLKEFDLVDDPNGFLGFTRMVTTKPTIAAIEGHCVAGGLEIALWCDLRIAGTSAVFGCFERRFGVPLIDGGTQRLPLVVGLGRALDMILTGRSVSASEALAMGLITRTVADGESLDVAIATAETIAAFPQETVVSDRTAVYRGIGKTVKAGLALERKAGLEVMTVAAEGAARFRSGEGRSGEGVG